MKQNKRSGLRGCAAGFEAVAMRIFVGLVFVAWVQASAIVLAGVPVGDCTVDPAGTLCADTDNNDCTLAQCNDAGNCDQNYPALPGTSCTEAVPNECTFDTCDGLGRCGQPNFGASCDDTDDNECSVAKCSSSGVCEQNYDNRDGDSCPDTDNIDCTEARCRNTFCDQNYPAQQGKLCTQAVPNECTFDSCDGSGNCGQPRTGFPCDDTDDNVCSVAKCFSGVCVQNADDRDGASCPDTDSIDCTEARCRNTFCDQNYPAQQGKSCTETVPNECTFDACDGSGNCGQPLIGFPCDDTDLNFCSVARCNSAGICNQNANDRDGASCPDTDGNDCTEARCHHTSCNQRDRCDDIIPPDITCPPDTHVFCREASDPSVTGEATATDDCDPNPQIDHSDVVIPGNDPASLVLEVIHRTWTAVDDCGNADDCEQTIEVLKRALFLDIKPGSCPNALDIRARGVIPMSLLGTADFDVSTVDVGSLLLVRADGVGGAIAPTSSSLQDTGTPFAGALCGCHRLGGDRIVDLSLKFDNLAVVSALQLNLVAPNASVQLVLSGTLSNGCKFIAGDCMVRTPVKGR